MFQNITEEEKIENIAENIKVSEKIDIKEILKKSFTKQNILVYILSLMLGAVSTVNGIAPFGLAIFAASLSNGLPAGLVFVFSLIGMMIGIGTRRNSHIYFYSTSFYRNGFNFQTMV